MSVRVKNVVLIITLLLAACRQESRESLLAEGARLLQEGNPKGAVVLYKTSLERFPDDPGTRFALAKAYLLIGKPDQAENELRKIANRPDTPVDLHLILGRVKLARRQPEQAREAFLVHLAAFPDSAATWEGIGLASIQAGELAKATGAFERALSLDPGLPEARCALTEILLRQHALDQAASQLDALFAHHPDHQAGMHLLARLHIAREDIPAAAAAYTAITAKYPKDIQARSQDALIRLMALGETQPAEKAAGTLIASAPNRPEGYRLRGLLELKKGEYPQAINSFQQALKQAPDRASNVLLAQAYASIGNPEMAITELCQVLDQAPDDARARLLLANLNMRLNRMDEALVELEKLLQRHPDDSLARRMFGDVMLSRGEIDKGLAILTSLESTQGPTPETHLRRGVILATQGRTAEAETALRQAVAMNAAAMEPRLVLATFLKQQGRFDEAEAALDLGDTDPGQAALAYNAKARIRLQQGRPEETEALLQKARALAPDLAMTYHNLAQLDFKEGRPEKAAYWYRTLLERHPDDVSARLTLAAALECLGRLDEAREQLGVAADTRQLQPLLLLADFLSRHGRPDKALETVDACLTVHKNAQPAHILKARLLFAAGDEAGAQAELQKLERLDKNAAFAERFRAALQTRKWDAAEALARKHLEESPRRADRFLPMSRLREAQGDLEAAKDTLRRGLEADPANVQARVALAMVLHKAGKSRQALEQLDALLGPGAPQVAAYNARGIIRQVLNDIEGAIADYENALLLKGQNLVALNNLAMLYADRPETASKALDLAWTAYNLDRNAPAVLDTLGYALLKNNRSANALAILNRAATLAPEDQGIASHLNLAKTITQ